jgi:hypothetical protein
MNRLVQGSPRGPTRSWGGLSALVMLAASLWAGCSNPTPAAPTPPSTPTPPAPTVTRVTIDKTKLTFNGIGQIGQLTVTATLSDGTTKDVTALGAWQLGDARIVNVSPTGLVTVVSYGSTWITFGYPSVSSRMFATATVTATPDGTFIISGRVREPGGGGLFNVPVVDTLSGRVVTTQGDGYFSFGELSSMHARLTVDLAGYEPFAADVTTANADVPLQRIVRLTAGETVKPDVLAPNDLSYTIDGRTCAPCRLIRVVVPQSGVVHVHVTWTVAASRLTLFVEGQAVAGNANDIVADVPIDGAREVLMYLGTAPPATLPDHTAFTFATSMS